MRTDFFSGPRRATRPLAEAGDYGRVSPAAAERRAHREQSHSRTRIRRRAQQGFAPGRLPARASGGEQPARLRSR